MAGSFLDTTVVVELAERTSSAKNWISPLLASNLPAAMPEYALRELLAGKVSLICNAHDKIMASDNVGEALYAVLRLPAFSGRRRDGTALQIADALKTSFEKKAPRSPEEIKREMVGWLAVRAQQLWSRGRKLPAVQNIQPLACFDSGDIKRGPANELRGPNGAFGCNPGERCGAARYLHSKTSEVTSMISALHPSKLGDKAGSKAENASRRKALKLLESGGPKEFNKRYCRAFGDAYFAAMCPAGSAVVTTNTVDHEPLCKALGKKVVGPPK